MKVSPVGQLNNVKQSQQIVSKADSNNQPKTLSQGIHQLQQFNTKATKEAKDFIRQLDEIENELIKKERQLEVLTSKEMSEISFKNMALVEQFKKYQQKLIKKLQGKHSNWDKYQLELSQLEANFEGLMRDNSLTSKLSKIEVLQEEVESLIKQVGDLNKRIQRK